MILEQVSLRNWRSYRGDGHSFSFGEGANLLVGPNESGKSTVLEAVRRGLLDRHTAKGKDLQQVRPLGSSLGPEVRLIFRSGGRRYRVLKRFLADATSRVSVERNGEFQLDHEGDAADRFLRAMLLAENATRGTLRPEQRGIAQALWFLQSEEGIPQGRWSEALEAGLREELSKPGATLQGLLKAASTSAHADAVEKRVQEEFELHYTPTGRVRANSELAELATKLEELELELERRRKEQTRVSSYRDELEALQAEDKDLLQQLGDLGATRLRLEQRLQCEPALAAELATVEEELRSVQRRQGELSAGSRAIAALDQRIAELDGTLRDGEEAVTRLRNSVREHRRSAERHARTWEDDLTPKVENIRTRIADLRARQRIDELEAEIQRLDEQLRRRKTLGEEVEQARTRLRCAIIVADDVWDRARTLAERAKVLRERVWAAGMRLSTADLADGTLSFSPEPEIDPASGELVLVQETTITIDGIGAITLRSADQRLKELDQKARDCQAQLDQLMAELGLEDQAELLIARERTLQVQRELQRAEDLYGEVAGSDDSQEAVAVLEARRNDRVVELRDLRERCPQSVLPGMEGWAEERTQDELRDLEQQRASLERTIREEREAEQEAQKKSLNAHEVLEKVSVNAAAGGSERTALRERLAAELEAFGDRASFEQAAHSVAKELSELEASREKLQQRFASEVEKPRLELAKVARTLQEGEERHRGLASQRTDRLARLEEAGALSLDQQIAELEVGIQSKRRRLETVSRRAKACAVLLRLFEHRRASQSHSWVEPVTKLVEGWMERLSGSAAKAVELDVDLVPRSVSLEGHEESLPLVSMSHGAKEQLVVLLRLALAVVLSQDEPQLVVLDDRLVNADQSRSVTLSEILNEVAEHCQLIVATCREDAYAAVSGRRIEVNRRGGFLSAADASS